MSLGQQQHIVNLLASPCYHAPTARANLSSASSGLTGHLSSSAAAVATARTYLWQGVQLCQQKPVTSH